MGKKKLKIKGGKGAKPPAAAKPAEGAKPPGAMAKLKNLFKGKPKGEPPGAGGPPGAGPGGPPAPTGAQAQAAQESLIAQVNENAKNSPLAKIIRAIGQVLHNIFRFFFSREYPIAHYITLLLVILFLIYGFSTASKSRRKEKRESWWRKYLGYRISGYLTTPITEPRKQNIGRCDNIDFIENRVGKNGVCVSNRIPDPIEWIIDSDKIPELKELPLDIKNKISNNGTKFKVIIPWKSDGLVYVPDCDGAMFADGTPAYLLADGGGICKKLELEKVIETPQYRYVPEYTKKYKGFDSFLTEPDTSSPLVEVVSPGEVCSIKAAKELGIYDSASIYKPDYDTIRTYNKDFDTNRSFTHTLCTESTNKKEATLLCPLVENAGIGFTNKPGSKCVTSECPTGFTEDRTDPMVCKKPIKERIVPLNMRNDEQYDDWYTIPNYHLGNKYHRIGSNNYAPCDNDTVPYYATDPVDNTMGDTDMKDQLDTCIDKSTYFGGKYSGTNNFCPISLIKRTGSSMNELIDYYLRVSNNENVPNVEKQKIFNIINSIKTENFANINILTDEMEAACNKLNEDPHKLEEAYNICEQLHQNEDGFMNKFPNEPTNQVQLRTNICKYSCQQLFGIPPENRSNPLASNENAMRIDKPPLTFPDAERIQFEEYIKEYENQIRKQNAPLPVISADESKNRLVRVFTRGYIIYHIAIVCAILLLLVIIYIKRRYIFWLLCHIKLLLYKAISWIPIFASLKAATCKTLGEIKEEELKEKAEKKQRKQEQDEAAEKDKSQENAAPGQANAAPGQANAAPGQPDKNAPLSEQENVAAEQLKAVVEQNKKKSGLFGLFGKKSNKESAPPGSAKDTQTNPVNKKRNILQNLFRKKKGGSKKKRHSSPVRMTSGVPQ